MSTKHHRGFKAFKDDIGKPKISINDGMVNRDDGRPEACCLCHRKRGVADSWDEWSYKILATDTVAVCPECEPKYFREAQST